MKAGKRYIKVNTDGNARRCIGRRETGMSADAEGGFFSLRSVDLCYAVESI
jgi:hypothetical protein